MPGLRTVATVVGGLLLMAAPARAAVLEFIEFHRDGSFGVDGLAGADGVAVSPDGAHVYAAGSVDNALAVFARDAASGSLSFVERHRDGVLGVDGLGGAAGVTVSPDGDHVYVAGFNEDALAVFARDALSGSLSFVEVKRNGISQVGGLAGAFSVTVSPDGRHVYVAGRADDALAVFERDALSGSLGFVEVQRNGFGGVQGLAGANSVAVSPDGDHVYVAGFNDDALAVFARDALSGSLSFVEVQRDFVAGVEGLSRAFSVALSPDGAHVYVASFSSALAVFAREAASGSLSFVEAHRDGLLGVDGLKVAFSVMVSPDGRHVYVAARDDNSLAVFARDAASGSLGFLEVQRDGVGGVNGLAAAVSVAASPDGAHVYATGFADDALAVFAPEPSHLVLYGAALGTLAGLARRRSRVR